MAKRRKKIFTPEYWQQQHKGTATSGSLAEKVVRERFDLQEPFIEVKACCHEYYRVVIKAPQFNECLKEDKVYCVVVYQRHRTSSMNGDGKRKCWFKLSIAEAFERQVKFFFIRSQELREIIEKTDARFVESQTYNQPDSFWHVKWKAIRDYLEEKYGLPDCILVNDQMPNRIWGVVPACPDDWTPF